MQQLQPQNSIKYLKKMGISTLTEEDETLVLALGGLQKGISTLEMAAGYAMIAMMENIYNQRFIRILIIVKELLF